MNCNKVFYRLDDVPYEFDLNTFSNEHIDVLVENKNKNITHFRVIIKTSTSKMLDDVIITLPFTYQEEDRIFMNGYQTWTTSREYSIHDVMKGTKNLPKVIVKKFKPDMYGDYTFYPYSHKKGELHGYTYAYIKRNKEFTLFGSVNDKKAFTIFETFTKENIFRIKSDCHHLIKQDFIAFDFYRYVGTEQEVFDQYFKNLNVNCKDKELNGYTSWYNYYQNIDEEHILQDLKPLSNYSNDIFQIDDGYETFVGDWLSIDSKKFPHGLKYIADEIHANNLKAGIWLAPFVCETKSELFQKHPDFLARDKKGHFISPGCNWSGFYLLDLKKKEVLDYIRHCFEIVVDEWGFDFVKLDFLYAAALKISENETRAEVMAKMCDFLRSCAKDKLILGCGVPLASCFNIFNYCRIGSDVSLNYKGAWYTEFFNREAVSTKNAITNTIYRRHLNGKVFINDPDVFLLRKNNIKMNFSQRKTLTILNMIFGGLYFTSDNLSMYDQQTIRFYNKVREYENAKVLEVTTLNETTIVIKIALFDKIKGLILNLDSGELIENI